MTGSHDIMTMISRLAMRAAPVALCLLVLDGCHRRPLEDPDYRTEVRVKIDVSGIQNVTCDIYNENIQPQKIEPSTMHVLFYDCKSGRIAAESYLTKTSFDEDGNRTVSGEMQIVPGSYRMLAYDFGTDGTMVRNYDRWHTAEAYADEAPDHITRKFTVKSGETPDIVAEPEHLVAASKERETIPYHEGIYTVYADGKSVVESWYIQIKVDGMEYVSSTQAVLSGMARSNLIATDTRIINPEATVWFRMVKSEDKGVPVVCAVFNTFGHIPDSRNDLAVTFEVVRTDGYTVKKTMDISGLFQTKNAVEHHWLLIDETIKVEPPKSSGGAFDPKVDGWEEESQDIEI